MKFANKLGDSVCEVRLGILERKKSCVDLSKKIRMKFSSKKLKIIVGLTD